jgi:hypothetical protein
MFFAFIKIFSNPLVCGSSGRSTVDESFYVLPHKSDHTNLRNLTFSEDWLKKENAKNGAKADWGKERGYLIFYK